MKGLEKRTKSRKRFVRYRQLNEDDLENLQGSQILKFIPPGFNRARDKGSLELYRRHGLEPDGNYFFVSKKNEMLEGRKYTLIFVRSFEGRTLSFPYHMSFFSIPEHEV